MSSAAMSAGEPQKLQFCATLAGSKVEIALQLWQRTVLRSICQPDSSSGRDCNASSRSFSLISERSVFSSSWDTVLQYGHTSVCLEGDHTASAPQAGQAYFFRAVTSSGMRGADAGSRRL